MSWPTTIQTFAGANTFQGSGNTQCGVDWTRGWIWIGQTHLSKSNISTGAEVASVLLSDLNDSFYHIYPACPPIVIGFNGDPYISSGVGCSRIDQSNLSRQDTWGGWSNPSNPVPPGLPYSTSNDGTPRGALVWASTASTQYLLGTGLGGTFVSTNQAELLRLPEFAGLNWTLDTAGGGGSHCGCAGPAGTGLCYVLSGSNSTSPGAGHVRVYEILATDGGIWVPADWPTPNPDMSLRTIVDIVPTDIDPSWTKILQGGVLLDRDDGNLIAFFTGTGGTYTTAIAKIDSSVGTVLWVAQLPGAGSPGNQWAQSRCYGGKLCYAITSRSGSPPNTLVTLDTTDGSYSTYTTGLNGLTFFNNQCFDSGSGAIIISLDWASASGGPSGLNGSAPHFQGWAALYVTAPVVPVAASRRYMGVCEPVQA